MSDEASISLAKVLNTGVRKHGKTILTNLSVALKVTKLYDPSHQNVRNALNELLELLQGFLRVQGHVNLTRIDDFLFLNDVRIQVDAGGYEIYCHIVELFKEREIGEISFATGLTATELEKLVLMLNESPPECDQPWDEFCEILSRHTLPNVCFSKHEKRFDHYDEDVQDDRVTIIQTFFKAIATTGKAFKSVESGRRINLKSIKTAVHAMVDLTLNAEHLLLGLTNVRDHGTPGANHAVNVAVLSIATGARLGLSKRILGDLGIAALLHDLGKVGFEDDLRASRLDTLEGDRFEEYFSHVYTGTEHLLRQSMVHQIVKSMNVAFLHHYRYDRTGYPQLMSAKEQNLFTRIVSIADHYDNRLTAGRFGGDPDTPEVVLRDLLGRGGTEFDPLVVKAFVNLMGLYPVGCMVRLDTNEVATVVAPPSHPRYLDRPTVRLVCDELGQSGDSVYNLMDRDAAGNFRRSILKLYQQEEVQLELDEYLAVI